MASHAGLDFIDVMLTPGKIGALGPVRARVIVVGGEVVGDVKKADGVESQEKEAILKSKNYDLRDLRYSIITCLILNYRPIGICVRVKVPQV